MREGKKDMKKINKPEFIAGAAVLVILLLGGGAFLQDGALYFRMLVGLGLGYTLARALFGFAGSANARTVHITAALPNCFEPCA